MGVLSQMLIAMLALFLLMDVDLLLGTEQAGMLPSISTNNIPCCCCCDQCLAILLPLRTWGWGIQIRGLDGSRARHVLAMAPRIPKL